MAGVHLITALIVILLVVIVVGLIRHPQHRRKPYIGGGAMENSDEYADWTRRQFNDGQGVDPK